MKKIDCILKGKKLMDRLFGLRKKQISRQIEAAKDDLEKQRVEAEIKYEELMNKLGEEEVDYKHVINSMIQQKGIILNASETLKAVAEIESDLDMDVEEPEE